MALSFTTGMTLISAADSVTNWAATRFAGSGGAPSASLDTTVLRQGSGSIGAKLAGNNWNAATMFDWYASTEGGKSANTTVNLSTSGNEVIAMWVQNTTPGVSLTQAANGMYVILSSSADSGTTNPTVYSEWTVYGSDVYPGGWTLVMIDTRKTPTSTVGGGCDLTAVRRIGFGNRNIASVGTVKADNVYVDAMWYGRPKYTLIGDGTTVGTWANFLAQSITNQDGLIESRGGELFLKCGVQFGTGSQSSTTNFTDTTGQTVVFERVTYYNGGIVDALNYGDYYAVSALGNGTTRTTVTFGTIVGAGDARNGVLGGAIKSGNITNVTWSMDLQTDAADLASVTLAGVNMVGGKGGILLNKPNGAGTVVSCIFNNCGEIDTGTTSGGAEMLNCSVIDPLGGTSNNYGLRLRQTHNIKLINFITSGSPTTQHMLNLSDSGTYSVTMDGLKFFGDYSSGTLWHGDLSNATLSTVTGQASNGANPNGAEFNKTGNASSTISVDNAVTITITVLTAAKAPIENAQTSIYTDTGTLILNTDTNASGIATTSYNYVSPQDIVVKVRKSETTDNPRYKAFSTTGQITATGFTLTVTLVPNPALN